jgi:hypothetical protein
MFSLVARSISLSFFAVSFASPLLILYQTAAACARDWAACRALLMPAAEKAVF